MRARGGTRIVLEGRVELGGMRRRELPVPCLDHARCFAEKPLADADRGSDPAFPSRDAIDLAFMLEAWPASDAVAGAALARGELGRTRGRRRK